MKSLREIVTLLKERKQPLFPCDEYEVRRIESVFDVRLPLLYKQFLLEMGRGAGEFMLGSSCFYDEIFKLREGAIEILEENGFVPLPDNSFVFWMHQGYQFAFFILDQSEDPPVYYYNEADNDLYNNMFKMDSESFTAFLNVELQASNLV